MGCACLHHTPPFQFCHAPTLPALDFSLLESSAVWTMVVFLPSSLRPNDSGSEESCWLIPATSYLCIHWCICMLFVIPHESSPFGYIQNRPSRQRFKCKAYSRVLPNIFYRYHKLLNLLFIYIFVFHFI